MSCSSKDASSLRTIAVQDSPEPPSKDSNGIVNKAYIPYTDEKQFSETKNSDLFGTHVVNLIPLKPMPQVGPFEPMADFFVPIKHQKKLFRRSEKLYVTKPKRKGRRWGRIVCLSFIGAFFAGVATVALLAVFGVISIEADKLQDHFIWTTTTSAYTPPTELETTTSRSETPPSINRNYLQNALDVEFSIVNRNYNEALLDTSSTQFQSLSNEIREAIVGQLQNAIDGDSLVVKIMDFSPGSIYTRMRIAWSNSNVHLHHVQFALRNVTALGLLEIKLLKSFGIINMCMFMNNGCSHTCLFDLTRMTFVCKCPESLVLALNNKTCQDLPPSTETTTTAVWSSTNPPPLPSSSSSSPTPSVTTSITTTTLAPITSLPPLLEPFTQSTTAQEPITEGPSPDVTSKEPLLDLTTLANLSENETATEQSNILGNPEVQGSLEVETITVEPEDINVITTLVPNEVDEVTAINDGLDAPVKSETSIVEATENPSSADL